MIRTVSDLMNQQNARTLELSLPQVKKKKVPVIDVLFPSHSLVVATQGYGRMTIKADPSIPFGTFGRPLVSSQSIATIEYSDTAGVWTATAIETSNRCLPTVTANVPNIPLPAFKPIPDSSIVFDPFRVDTNFNPHVGPMGQIVPNTKMPPGTGGMPSCGNVGDILIWNGTAWQCFDLCAAIAACATCTVTFDATVITSAVSHGVMTNVLDPIKTISNKAYMIFGQVGSPERVELVVVSGINNPATASIIGTLLVDTGAGAVQSCGGLDWDFASNLFFFGTGVSTVFSIDISTPSAPSLAGSGGGSIIPQGGMIVFGDITYYVAVGPGVDIYDISTDPTTPALVQSLSEPGLRNQGTFFDYDNYVLYTNDVNTPSVRAYQIFDPDTLAAITPVLLGSLTYAYAATGAGRIDLYQNALYAEVDDVSSNRLVGIFEVDGLGGFIDKGTISGVANFEDFKVSGTSLYVTNTGSVQCVQLALPLATPFFPRVMGSSASPGGVSSRGMGLQSSPVHMIVVGTDSNPNKIAFASF